MFNENYAQVEERQFIREKIKESYRKTTSTYEELLETAAALEEEFVYLSAPSRLDYFKSGIQYDKRIMEKRRQVVPFKDVDEAVAPKKSRTDSDGAAH